MADAQDGSPESATPENAAPEHAMPELALPEDMALDGASLADGPANAPENPPANTPANLPPCKMPRRPHKPRHSEWTRTKMVTFLRELAASQNVAQSARAVGMSRQSAYRLRNALKGTPFDLGWETALEMGFGQLAQAVMDRALNGEEVVHYHRGEVTGTSRRYDNFLARWVLENPWKLGRHQVAREFSSEAFETLLERIEWGGMDWEAGDVLPGRAVDLETPVDEARDVQDRFAREDSWYAADARAHTGPRRG